MNLFKLLCYVGIHRGEWSWSVWRKYLTSGPMVYRMERYCSVCEKHEEKLLKNLEDLMKKNKKYHPVPHIHEGSERKKT